MASYTLTWEIDWDADSPKEAAQEVVREFFAGVGQADHFTVTNQATGEVTEVNAFSGDDEEPAIVPQIDASLLEEIDNEGGQDDVENQ